MFDFEKLEVYQKAKAFHKQILDYHLKTTRKLIATLLSSPKIIMYVFATGWIEINCID
jgi:hypothetical protein